MIDVIAMMEKQRCHVHGFVTIGVCGCVPDPTIWSEEAMRHYIDVKNIPESRLYA